MNYTSFRYTSAVIFSIVFLCLAVLYMIGSFYSNEKFWASPNFFKYDVAASENITAEEHLASNDFSLTHENGKEENIQHTLVYTLQAEKLLRQCIFDRDKILILTQTLTWFTHTTYRVSLPPAWHPSIPIAHRRLII